MTEGAHVVAVASGLPGDAVSTPPGPARGVWRRLRADRFAMGCLAIVAGYLLVILASAAGWIASDWSREVAVSSAPPSWWSPVAPGRSVVPQAVPAPGGPTVDLRDIDPLAPRYEDWRARSAELARDEPQRAATLPLGADKWGRDVLAKAIKGAEVSVLVGLGAALLATAIGTGLGALAGYFGGWIDDTLEWLYNVFTAVPNVLLILAFAAVLRPGVANIVLVLGLTGWTGVYRLIRAEYMKQRVRDYVRAARSFGVGSGRLILRHILPNAAPVALVQLSQLVVGFIKAEVILSFLGFGVPVDAVSWGTMLAEAQSELIVGQWWQLAGASVSMAVLVGAFALFTDALRDALDPRLSRPDRPARGGATSEARTSKNGDD